jgi:hypothetical protein
VKRQNCLQSTFDAVALAQAGARPYLRDATRACAQTDLVEYLGKIDNRSRRHSTLGYCSWVRRMENWISKHAAQQSVAA